VSRTQAGQAATTTVQIETGAPPEWSQLLAACTDIDFFRSELWTRAACRHFPDTTAVWLVARREGRLLGALPAVRRRRRGLSYLASNIDGTSGGPLVAPDASRAERHEIYGLLLRRYAGLLGGRTVAATVSLNAAQEREFGPVLRDANWSREAVLGAVVPLAGGIDFVETDVLSNNRRNERNRAVKRGCTAHVTDDPDVLDAYYPIYRDMTLKWGSEATPLGFLKQLLAEGEGRAFLVYVRYEGEIIGGYVNVHWGDRVIAWNGASKPEHNKRLFPATLVNWQSIVESCRRGAAYFDLGGSAGISSLSRFKKLMGAEPEIRGQYSLVSGWYRSLRQCRDLLRRDGGGS